MRQRRDVWRHHGDARLRELAREMAEAGLVDARGMQAGDEQHRTAHVGVGPVQPPVKVAVPRRNVNRLFGGAPEADVRDAPRRTAHVGRSYDERQSHHVRAGEHDQQDERRGRGSEPSQARERHPAACYPLAR